MRAGREGDRHQEETRGGGNQRHAPRDPGRPGRARGGDDHAGKGSQKRPSEVGQETGEGRSGNEATDHVRHEAPGGWRTGRREPAVHLRAKALGARGCARVLRLLHVAHGEPPDRSGHATAQAQAPWPSGLRAAAIASSFRSSSSKRRFMSSRSLSSSFACAASCSRSARATNVDVISAVTMAMKAIP
jgi:hypothetical protein